MPKTKTRVWDPAEHLITNEDMAAYLEAALQEGDSCLLYTSPSPRDGLLSRMPSSA